LRGRKDRSLARGLALSHSETVLFLDADTLLPPFFDRMVRECIAGQVVGGAFRMKMAEGSWGCRLVSAINQVRYRMDRIYFGDQAFFCLRRHITETGGFPDKPLMEISYLCRQLRQVGKLRLVDAFIETSCRRFERVGVFKLLLFDTIAWLRFLLRMDLSRMAKGYWV